MSDIFEKPTGKKKMVLIGIIICVILIVILTFIILFYKQIDATTFKLYIDGQQVSYSNDFYIQDDSGNIYLKARELASLIGWTYQNGEYGSYTEDTDSGYMQNEYEVASFVAGSTTLKKYIEVSDIITEEDSESSSDEEDTETVDISVYSENGTLETTELELPIISSNNQIYIPLACINDICNCSYSNEQYRLYIYELNYLIDLGLQKAASYGYSSVSGTYENLRALAYGMLVAIDNTGRYGVVTLNSGESLLGFKYSDMVFNQNVKEFLVKASDNTVGIVSYDGTVIISPKNYDNISILNDSLNLYLIEKDSQYGVLNRNGDVVIYPEYDSIGLSDEVIYTFDLQGEERDIINGNTIVVEKDGLYGLYNLDGKNVLGVNYQGIGYITESDETAYEEYSSESTSSSSKSSSSSNTSSSTSSSSTTNEGNSVLTINMEFDLDDGTKGVVNGIVVKLTSLSGEYAYGIYDSNKESLIIPCGCSRIYSVTRSGVTTYYMEYNGQQIEFNEDYVKELELYTVIEDEQSSDEETDNITNSNSTNTTNNE